MSHSAIQLPETGSVGGADGLVGANWKGGKPINIYLSIYRSIYLSVCLSIYLSVCLSIYLSIDRYICRYTAEIDLFHHLGLGDH